MEETTSANLSIELLFRSSIEREHACKHDEQYNSESPYICCEARVLLFLNDFWGHVRWSTTEYFKFAIIWLIHTEAVVNDFNIISVINENVL